jgi:hypothetical protein
MERNRKTPAGLILAGLFLGAGMAGAQGPECNPQNVRGSYGLLQSGKVPGFGQFVGVGVATFDARGRFSASSAGSFEGIFSETTVSGNYTVHSDCTGSIAYTFPNGVPGTLRFVAVDNGKEILAVETTPVPGMLMTHLMKRQ